MCGIFALLNYDENLVYTKIMHQIMHQDIKYIFNKGKGRGPESSTLKKYLKLLFGFHRLAINGLNEESNQPLEIDNIILICNGEIYNYKELYTMMNITPKTGSDCEVIIHLYKKYGIEQTLQMLDGVFAFVLYDARISNNLTNHIYVARDPLGVRPLYALKNKGINEDTLSGFASELKCLADFYLLNPTLYNIEPFLPGTYSIFKISEKATDSWKVIKENVPYFIPSFSHSISNNLQISSFDFSAISSQLKNAVFKRCVTTERPIACLLSGGLDSSLICALVNEFYKTNNYDYRLETYSIGLLGSEDLKYASKVAEYLGTNHTEIIVTEQEMFEAIPNVIYAIESYDTTTVRASIGNYLLGKYISENSEAKVIFNGDGSDELCGGYLYMNKCPDDIEFDGETRRLLKDIHTFDVLRSDKCISCHGLEPRTPFLDRNFVNFYLSLPIAYRNHKNNLFRKEQCEKFLLRNSFSKIYFTNHEGNSLLPDEILWRRKEAFSDGVSSHGRSLYQILQEFIAKKLDEHPDFDSCLKPFPVNIETEKIYYKRFFGNFYPYLESVIPYYWMPKYTQATDPSARTLDVYKANGQVDHGLEDDLDMDDL